MQKLDKTSQATLHTFRERERQGHLPPLTLKYDEQQGFYVEAACNMQELTLVAEYLGQVRTGAQTLNDTNDSIMELLCHKRQADGSEDPEQSLVIVPYQFANAARFFNGINNSKKGSKKTVQNIKSMRCQVDGKATVLIFTKRAVKKGEVLVYDYNEAGKNMYPTSHFL